jgi:gliding motility-associated-like protein
MPDRFTLLLVVTFLLNTGGISAQKIVDPCFKSIPQPGHFSNAGDIINVCDCPDNYYSSDLIEWTGSGWVGSECENIVKPPPPGCNTRALWVGYQYWTARGEAFALRLDKPLQAGHTYSYTFTYAKDGNAVLDEFDADEFSPIVYTDDGPPRLPGAYQVGRLPATVDWTTNTITFTAVAKQAGHTFIILRGVESSGSFMSNCDIENPSTEDFFPADTLGCIDEAFQLDAGYDNRYTYKWSTGETTGAIDVRDAGTYYVTIDHGTCSRSDTVRVGFENCDVIFDMPNVFTPNFMDTLNRLFLPLNHNYIESAQLIIYNRWGSEVFIGDAFEGWSGMVNGSEAPAGVYFYAVEIIDRKKKFHFRKGSVTLMK